MNEFSASPHVKLTRTEILLLCDGLEAVETVAAAVTSASVAVMQMEPAVVRRHACLMLASMQNRGTVSLDEEVSILIIEHCMCCCTLLAQVAAEVRDRKAPASRHRSLRRAAGALQHKLAAAAGRSLKGFPLD